METKTSSLGRGRSVSGCTSGRATFMIWRSIGKTFFSHQRATSGNDSSCSVSPVGAQSTTSTSNSFCTK